jgi:hypothetical protein
MATSSGLPVCSIGPDLVSSGVPASITYDSRRSGRGKVSALATGMRYSRKREARALKPLVVTFAMLLAMTSSSRPSATWRDRPMRSAFSMNASRCCPRRAHIPAGSSALPSADPARVIWHAPCHTVIV